MTYPPGNPGYPPAQSSGSYGAPSPPSFNKADDGESSLQQYLTIAVLALGLLIYLFSYGPLITHVLPNGDELIEKDPIPIGLALLAGLLAGTSLLPKAKNYAAVITVVASVGALLFIEDAIGATGRGWALWAAVSAAVVQVAVVDQRAVAARRRHHPARAAPQIRPVRALRPVRLLRPAAGSLPAVRLRHAVRRLPVWAHDRRLPRAAGTAGQLAARIAHPANGFPQLQPAAVVVRLRQPRPGQLGGAQQLRPQPALVRPGSAASGALLAVGPVSVLTMRTRARRVACRTAAV